MLAHVLSVLQCTYIVNEALTPLTQLQTNKVQWQRDGKKTKQDKYDKEVLRWSVSSQFTRQLNYVVEIEWLKSWVCVRYVTVMKPIIIIIKLCGKSGGAVRWSNQLPER